MVRPDGRKREIRSCIIIDIPFQHSLMISDRLHGRTGRVEVDHEMYAYVRHQSIVWSKITVRNDTFVISR